MRKHVKKPILKRSLLSCAVALAVGGLGQEAFAVDLCTGTANQISALSPADECLLGTAGESLSITGTGSLGEGVDVTIDSAPITVAAGGVLADDWTAIYFNSVGLGGSLSNAGKIEVDANNTWAGAVYIDENISASINNSGLINAQSKTSSGYAVGVQAIGLNTSTYTPDSNPAASILDTGSVYSNASIEATGSLVNSGQIIASAESTNTDYVTAYGIDLGAAVLGDITNSGSILAEADNTYDDRAEATAINVDSGTIGNWDYRSRSVGAVYSSTFATDYTVTGLGAASALTNSGSITAAARANDDYATATAIDIDGVVLGSIINSGTVAAHARTDSDDYANATAMYLDGAQIYSYDYNQYTNGTVANDWSRVTQDANVALGAGAALSNSGTISANADSGDDYASALALGVDGIVNGSISNSSTGTISAIAEGEDYVYAQAVGIWGGWSYYDLDDQDYTSSSTSTATTATSATSTVTRYASSDLYIGINAGASLTNAGTISAVADASSSSATAYGVEIDGGLLGTLDNSGTISAVAVAEDYYAYAYGVDISLNGNNSQASWSGNSTTTSDYTGTGLTTTNELEIWNSGSAYHNESTYSAAAIGAGAVLSNTGTISATARAGSDTAQASALSIDGAVLGTLTNTGNILADASAEYYAYASALDIGGGVVGHMTLDDYSWGDTTTVSTIDGATVDTTETDYVYASDYAWNSGDSDIGLGAAAALSNSGTINATAVVAGNSSYYATATGAYIGGAVLGAINNGGTISAEASSDYGYADAYGLEIAGGDINSYNGSYDYNEVSETKVVTDSVAGSVVTTFTSNNAYNTAYTTDEAFIGLGAGASLTNAGTISASASADYSAQASALEVYGAVLGTVANTGTISADAVAQWDSYAYAAAAQVGGGDVYHYTYAQGDSYQEASTGTEAPLVSTYSETTGTTSHYTSHTDVAYVGLGSAASLTNSGVISATASVVNSSSAYATALAVDGMVLGAINNSGSIAASATAGDNYAYAYGLEIYGGGVYTSDYSESQSGSGSVTRDGLIEENTSQSTTAYNYASSGQSWSSRNDIALGAGASLINSGSITATAMAGDLASNSGYSAYATAVSIDGVVLGTITNSGTIAASATAGSDYAYAYGVDLDGGDLDTYTGNGSSTRTDTSDGVGTDNETETWVTSEADVALAEGASFVNSGTISATAVAGSASNGHTAYASALSVSGIIDGALSNTGLVSASASAGHGDAFAYGLDIYGGSRYQETGHDVDGVSTYDWTDRYTAIGATGSVTNDGTILAVANVGDHDASAYGVTVNGVVDGALTNNGRITAQATSGGESAYAEGLAIGGGSVSMGDELVSTSSYVGIGQTGALTNTGAIDAFAEAATSSAYATGIYVSGEMAGSIVNSGTVRAAADATDSAGADGLYLSGTLSGSLVNSGSIDAVADAASGWASAAAVSVYDVSGSIANSGTIGAEADAGTGGSALGIEVSGHLTGSIGNTGTIDVAAVGAGLDGTDEATAVAIGVTDGASGTGTVTNSGYVGVTVGMDGTATAYGVAMGNQMRDQSSVVNTDAGMINVQADIDGDIMAAGVRATMLFDQAQILNAGQIAVTGNAGLSLFGGSDASGSANVDGISATGLYDSAVVSNTGDVSVELSGAGNVVAAAMRTGSVHQNATLSNSGTLEVAVAGGAYNVNVAGLVFDGAYDGGAVSNSGTIDASATGNLFIDLFDGSFAGEVEVAGIDADGHMVDASLVNSGTIHATAGGIADAAPTGLLAEIYGAGYNFGADGKAYGIRAGLVDGASTITNSGTIMAEAEGGHAYGIYVRALTDGASVVNTGTIEVDAGETGNAWGVWVNGGVDGLVDNSGTIGGGFSLGGTVSMNNAGTITGNAASVAGGNYTQAATGLLAFPVKSVDQYGQLAVGGTADFTAGNTIRIDLDAADDLQSGDVLNDVIAAGTLTATSFNVTDNHLFWAFDQTIENNTLDLTADYLGALSVLGGNLNISSSLAGVIDGIIAEGSEGFYADLAAQLSGAADAATAARIAEGFLPALNGGVASATRAATAGMPNVIDARIAQTRGAASGDAFKDGGVWLKPYFSNGEQDADGVINGYDVESSGVVIGVDGEVAQNWRAGLAVGSAKSDVTDRLADVNVSSTLVSLYGAYQMNERTSLDLTLGFADNSYDSARIAGLSGVANASFSGDQLNLGAKLARAYQSTETRTFTPSVAMQYTQVNVGGYSETGGGIFAQTVQSVEEVSMSIMADAKWEWTMSNSGVFGANIGLGYDNADSVSATSTLANNGPTYSTNGIQPEELFLGAGLGYSYVTSKNLELSAAYDLEARDGFQNGVASVKVKMPF